ncbi:GNAT family N-acetyltransferase [bacterium]|nr:GNAT family N-acetyltransferase [bacterium]
MRVRRGLEDEFNPFWGPMWRTERVLRSTFERDSGIDNGSWGQLAITDGTDDRAVGIEILAPMCEGQLDALIGTLILRRHWSRGFGMQAKRLAMCYMFENFAVERVSARTLATHVRALTGLRRCGMRCEGLVPCSQYSAGSHAAMSHWVITRREWRSQPWLAEVHRGNGGNMTERENGTQENGND